MLGALLRPLPHCRIAAFSRRKRLDDCNPDGARARAANFVSALALPLLTSMRPRPDELPFSPLRGDPTRRECGR